MSDARKSIWREFLSEVPWLKASDRAAVEMITVLVERMRDNTATVAGLGQLRLLLSACGATPTSRGSLNVEQDEDEDDAVSRFFN